MNIEANHVSVDGLRINDEISKLLDKYEIKTYEDLGICIYNSLEISNNYFLNKAYFDFKSKLMFQQQLSAEKIYQEYLNIVSNNQLLNLKKTDIDRMVKVVDLPLFISQPKLIYAAIYGIFPKPHHAKNISSLGEYSIEYLKSRMNESIVVGDEVYPRLIRYKTGIGEVKYTQLVATLKFYDQYIDTLLEKYSDKENPFYYMHDEKLAIVREQREKIFHYLYNVGYELVFGTIDGVMEIIDQQSSTRVLKKRLWMIENVIANYVTYDEALNITSPKVLNRFIVPYGKR